MLKSIATATATATATEMVDAGIAQERVLTAQERELERELKRESSREAGWRSHAL